MANDKQLQKLKDQLKEREVQLAEMGFALANEQGSHASTKKLIAQVNAEQTGMQNAVDRVSRENIRLQKDNDRLMDILENQSRAISNASEALAELQKRMPG